MSIALEVNQVGKTYEGFALQDINFSLDEGLIMGLIGTNGAGKTTLIQIILGLLREYEGEIKIFGTDIRKEEKKAKDLCGFVLDANPFIKNISAKENARLYGPYYSKWNEDSFLKLCKRFEVDSKKPLHKLSQGTVTKFQLAFALSHEARLLVFDEPSAGLDPIFRRELVDIMCDITMEERSILFSTHLTGELDTIADYITMLHRGHQLFSMPKDDLLGSYDLVRGTKTQLDALGQTGMVGRSDHDTYSEALIAKSENAQRIGVTIMRPTIEDIMLYSVKQGGKV